MSAILLLTQRIMTKLGINKGLISILMSISSELVVSMKEIDSTDSLMISAGIAIEDMEALERSGNLNEYIEEVLSRVKWNHRTKRTTLNKLIIANIRTWLEQHIEKDRHGVPIIRKNAVGGIYYAKIATYFYECKKKSIEIAGIMCYCCEALILMGESCISGSKGTGKKYYHIKCALLKGVV